MKVRKAGAAALLSAGGVAGALLLARVDGGEQTLTAGAPATPAAERAAWQASLRPQDGSGQSGAAVLTPTADGRTRIEISLPGAGHAPLPAHVYVGTCTPPLGQPRFALTAVQSGRSETTVPVPLQELLDGKFSIGVQSTGDAPGTVLACGELAGG